MKRCAASRLSAVCLVVCAVGVWVAGDASADMPVKQGWWSRWQGSPVPGSTIPATVPGPPATTPTGPTGQPPPQQTGIAESGGLTIARDATQVAAVAAVYFQVAPGADASLYLGNAGGRELVLPADARVRACVATVDWDGESNGPWSRAPLWSDVDCVTGQVVATKLGIIWNLPASMQDEDGVLSVVIVPDIAPAGLPTGIPVTPPVTVPPDAPDPQAPYLINFAATGEQTLVADEPPPDDETSTTTTTLESESTTDTTEPVVEETDPLVYSDFPGPSGDTGFPLVTTAVPVRTPTSLVASGPTRRPPFNPFLPDSRAERIMAVSLLLTMAGAMWWQGGNPGRMPRLIGALAGDGRASVPPPVAARGVGRFARPRDVVRPPRL